VCQRKDGSPLSYACVFGVPTRSTARVATARAGRLVCSTPRTLLPLPSVARGERTPDQLHYFLVSCFSLLPRPVAALKVRRTEDLGEEAAMVAA
jgi:hypothetical protein